jgi:O-antigen/teichoic acid export membrane protein
MKALRDLAGMGLLWAIGWGLGLGGVIEAFVDPHGEVVDIWPMVLAIPGFAAGITFCALLWIVQRRRWFDAPSLPRVVAVGAATGLLTGVVAAWYWVPGAPAGLIIPATILLSAISAPVSLAVIRAAGKLRDRPA